MNKRANTLFSRFKIGVLPMSATGIKTAVAWLFLLSKTGMDGQCQRAARRGKQHFAF